MKRVLFCGGLLGLMLLSGCGKKPSGGPSAPGWTGFDPEKGKFSVAMPGTPTESPLKSGSPGKMWTSQADGLTYSVSYEDIQLPAGAADTDQAQQAMDNEVGWMIDAVQGGTLADQKQPLIVGGQPGREVVINVDAKTLRRIRMCIVGDRLYMVEVSGPVDKVSTADVDSFLDSFKVAK